MNKYNTIYCDKCGREILDRNNRITLKAFKTVKAEDYYTKECRIEVMHYHRKCYKELHSVISIYNKEALL